MTSWNLLNAFAIGTAIVIFILISRLKLQGLTESVQTAWQPVYEGLQRRSGTILVFAVVLTLVLYRLLIRAGGAFDDLEYAIIIRDTPFYYNWNHFLPHVAAGLSYKLYHLLTHSLDSLYATKLINIAFGAFNVYLFYRMVCLLWPGQYTLGVLFSLLFGFSFGIWKFAASGEVYTVMMTFLLLPLIQFSRMARDDDWSPHALWMLALLANVSVLAHNVTCLIGFAIGVPLLLHRPKAFARYVLYGLLLFVVMQSLVAYTHGMRSLSDWYHFNFFAATSGQAVSNQWLDLRLQRNIPLVLRDGTLTIIAGIELAFRQMSFAGKTATVFVYAMYWLVIFWFFKRVISSGKTLWQRFRSDRAWQAIVGHLLLFGMLNCIWAPGEEQFTHWLIPYLLLSLLLILKTSGVQPARAALGAALFLPILIWSSIGTSRHSSSKIWTLAHPPASIDKNTKETEFRNGDLLIYLPGQDDQVMRYLFPEVPRSREIAAVRSAFDNSRRTVVDNTLAGTCPALWSSLQTQPLNSSYSLLQAPLKGAMAECPSLTVMYLKGPALR